MDVASSHLNIGNVHAALGKYNVRGESIMRH